MRKMLCGVAAVAAVAGALAGVRADDGFVDREGKAGDGIENHYPIPMSKPTVEEITNALEKLLARAEKANVVAVVDSETKKQVTDFSAVNPNARVSLGGYPIGVLHAGMLMAAEATGEKGFSDFVAKRVDLVGMRHDYFAEQAKTIGMAKSSFKNFLEPANLDACGAWGAALVKAKRAGVVDPSTMAGVQNVIDTWAGYVSEKQFRLEDGTLARNRPVPDALWGDDMYMSIPFLAQMYKDTGKAEYLELAVKQGEQIPARLFHPEKGLYSHFWFASNSELPVERYWGRVNGWCLMAECELLDVMPEDHPKRAEILGIVRRHIQGLTERQSTMGLWHQLLDREDTFLETSCTAMFTYGIAHAVNKGWVSPWYGAVAQAGWNGVVSRQNGEGGFDGTCIGTDVSADAAYYAYRPVTDDVHGYGPVMMAGAEMIKLLKNPEIVVKYVRGGIYVYESKKEASGKSE